MRRGDIIIRLQVRNSVLEEAGQDYEEKMKARHKALSSCSFILAAEFYCLFINSCQDETGTAPVFARYEFRRNRLSLLAAYKRENN